MTTRKRALTAQIKPATRNAIMDQLALAADEIVRLRREIAALEYRALPLWAKLEVWWKWRRT